MHIRSVGVLGAGTMGAQIAAHVANVGVPVLLLDVTADAATQGLDRARRLKPDPAFTPDSWTLISTGSFDTDLPRLRESDWIIEAVVERLDIKRALLERVDVARRAGSIVTSNTSTIPLAKLIEGMPDGFARDFARSLSERTGLPVHLQDERLSSREAESRLARTEPFVQIAM